MRYNQSRNKSKLCCFGYVDYIVLASTLSIALAEELTTDDINILATFFAVLADELALVSAVEACSSGDEEEEDFPPPVTDVALTTASTKNSSKRRTRIKKIKRKRIKK